MLQQKSWWALSIYAAEIKSGSMTVVEGEAKCKQACDEFCRELKAKGIKYSRSIMRNQLKPYWGFGDPCGLSCKSWVVSWVE